MKIKEIISKIPQNKRTIIIAALAFIVIITSLAFIAYFQSQSFNRKTYATITNYNSSIPNAPRKNIEAQLRNNLAKIFDIDDNTKVEATIRENSTTINNNYITFLVDIDAYETTYRVSVERTDNSDGKKVSDGIIIRCPKNSELKYRDRKCVSLDNDSDSLDLYFPHEETIKNDIKVEMKLRKTPGMPGIGAYVIACGEKSILDEAVKSTKKYLDDNDLDTKLYNIIPIDTCTAHNSK